MASVDPYIRLAVQRQARQLVLKPNQKPGLIFESGSASFGLPIPGSQIRVAVMEILSADQKHQITSTGSVSLTYTAEGINCATVAKLTKDGAEVAFVPQKGRATIPPGQASASASAKKPPLPDAPPSQVAKGYTAEMAVAPEEATAPPADIDRFLRQMVERKASDLHLCSRCHPIYRIDGDLSPDGEDAVFETDVLHKLLFDIVDEQEKADFEDKGSCDFAYEIKGVARFRFNIFKEYRGLSAAIRMIPSEILSAEDLKLPKAIRALASLPKGLVLVTGPTGSGKSTTLAAIIDLVNRSRSDHIITIEHPIEFLHPNKRCLVHQREVGPHTASFNESLRDALREDPDVVLVGELRDLETISMAIETASTGHLVFGTLHTTTATSTVNRIVEIFPSDEQSQIRYMLAESLKAVVAQNLLKRIGGGRVAALEVLIVTPPVSNMIREAKTHQLLNVIQTNRQLGMQLLSDELTKLVVKKVVDPGEAYSKAVDKDELLRQFKMNGIDFTPPKEFGG